MLNRLVIILVLFAALGLAAEDAPIITGLEVRGNSRIATDTILYYLDVHEGDPLDPDKIRANTRKLIDLNLTADLQIRAEETEGGVRLIVEVVERPILKTLAFKGNKALSANQLKDKFKEKKLGLTEGRELLEDSVQKARAMIQDAYKEIGYPAAEVTAQVETVGQGQEKLTLVVDEGTKVAIGEIAFIGNTLFTAKRLKWAMKKTKEHSIISRLSKHNLYSAESFREDADRIKALYRSQGYKDIKVGEPRLETYVPKPQKPQQKRLRLTVPIEEGQQYFIRRVAVEGATVFPTDRLMQDIKLTHGEILNFQKLQDVVNSIQSLYNGQGYISAGVIPEFDAVGGEDHLLDITLQVEEGDQFRVGRVEFKGNTKTLDKVLRREMGVTEGEIFNANSFRQTLMRLSQLGFYKLNEEKPVEPDIDAAGKQVNLTLFGEEAAKTDLQFAAGYSEVDGFFGQVFFSTRNFLGRGETLSLGYQSGKRRTFYELTYLNPWFLDTPNSVSGSIYNRKLDYPAFTRYSKGLGVGYGYRLATFSSLSFYYNYEEIRAEEDKRYRYPWEDGDHERPVEDPSIGGRFKTQRGTASSITPTFRWDTRDNPFDPFKGLYFSTSARYAGGGLGGTIDLFKPEVSFTLFQPLRRNWTTMLHVEGGVIIKTGNEIPSYERYFLGGENSLRGYSWRSVYPVDAQNGTIGGTKYLQFNIDSIWRLQSAFRLVAFLDAGYAWNETHSFSRMSTGDLRYSTGLELRIFLPVFTAPLRFIYGIILDPRPNEDRTNFQFTIGTSF
jgi:outer membrane protein insertion porin family